MLSKGPAVSEAEDPPVGLWLSLSGVLDLRGPHCVLQEKRRAERAEQQRIRSEREKERQARLAVSAPSRSQ